MCLRYTMRPASAILGGVLGRNFVNPKYFFCLFRSKQLFFFFFSLKSLLADVFTKANAPNFSQVISFITGNKLSAFKTQEHHFSLIKEGYVGTLSSVDNPTFDQFKKHLLTQHKIEGIQLPNVISDVQTEEKSKTKKKKKYRKRKNKNKKDTSAYVQPMQPSATRNMGS